MTPRRPTLPRFSSGILVTTLCLLTLTPFGSTGAREVELDARRIRSLAFNGRVIRKQFEYFGRENVDTGFSVEECLVFRTSNGDRIFMLQGGLAKRFFLLHGNYTLELRFIGHSRRGVPLARAAGRSALVRQEANPYEGDIRESDLRVKELKANLLRGRAAPNEIRLRYSGKRGDYLAFYDIDGEEVYYRYREDRFDRLAERRVRDLIPGQAYVVTGAFLGVLLKNKLVLRGAGSFRRDLSDDDSIPAYQYEKAVPLRLEQILF